MIELKHNNYLVTGAAGFIGSHICEEILLQGKQVIGVDNLVAGKLENIAGFCNDPGFTFINQSVVDIDKNFPGIFEGVDIVFHNAASKCTVCRVDPKQDLMVNAWGSHCVFNAARKAGVEKVIHASTGSVFNGKPKSNYGVSKLAGEAYLNAFHEYYPGFRYSILRYFHVYGSRQESSNVGGVIPIFIKKIINGEVPIIESDGEQVRHFTNVKDIVAANFFLANNQETDFEDYECRSDVTISIHDLAIKIYKLMGKEVNLATAPTRPGDIRKFNASNEKLKKAGFVFKDNFDCGLEETINWYRENL